MAKRKNLLREFFYNVKRFEHAREQAKKHIRRAEAWTIIMNDAVNEQHRINKELGNHDQEDEP